MTIDDIDLVQQYARTKSEEAFATIVRRHINIVYSVALRQVRDPHLAQEVTQTVFLILSRKAGVLSSKTIVAGWLCQTARYVAAKALTSRRRRENREMAAFMQSSPSLPDESDAWIQIEPLLEPALSQLPKKDHDALVVRFFQGRNFKEISSVLGTTEAGAKMRVSRALEKLKNYFTKHGIRLPAAVIAVAVSTHAVQAAPPGLSGGVTLAVFHGTAVTTSTLNLVETTIKYMTWTKIKTGVVAGTIALLALGTSTLTIQHSFASQGTEKSAVHGYGTPESTLKSLIAALEVADQDRFAAACTPQKAQQFRSRNAERSEAELKREAGAMAKAFSSYEILKKESISPTEMRLSVKATGKSPDASPGDRTLIMVMKKIGNEWKYDGDLR